ncbi:MAG: glycosyltransferase family A protein [Candidatus Acidiferrales bacterium]
MNDPLVSVVLVICNVDRFLVESIESVLAQTRPNFEFIIVDFGSTDNSKVIASSYARKDSRIKFYEIPHCGLAAARNAGCFLARGKYIAIQDADDVSLPHRLDAGIDFMEANPGVGVVGGAVQWIDAAGRPLETYSHPLENSEIQAALRTRCPLWQPTVLIRRDVFNIVEGYRAAFSPAEDYDLWIRISERWQLANLKDVVLQYRIHPQQVSMRKQREQTLGVLAARASAELRRNGRPDPFGSVEEITPALLDGLGVSYAMQQNEIISECRRWIWHQCMAGEYPAALSAATDLLHSDLELVEKLQIADLYLTVARLNWRKRKFGHAGLAAIRAILTAPLVAGRALNPVLRRLGFAVSPRTSHIAVIL